MQDELYQQFKIERFGPRGLKARVTCLNCALDFEVVVSQHNLEDRLRNHVHNCRVNQSAQTA